MLVIILLVSGVLGFVCISAFWTLPGILLVVGGILEIVGGPRRAPMGVASPVMESARIVPAVPIATPQPVIATTARTDCYGCVGCCAPASRFHPTSRGAGTADHPSPG
jgi:hypothetical protein